MVESAFIEPRTNVALVVPLLGRKAAEFHVAVAD